jgi:MinD-like ATPase involved in chromosome partitioning or flagellar assembly
MSSPEQHRQPVTLVSPFGQHQVDLPVDVPASGLLPDLLAMAGLHPSQVTVAAEGWRLEDAGGNAVAPGQTLAEHGIAPGDLIQLRGVQQPGAGDFGSAGAEAFPYGPPNGGLVPVEPASVGSAGTGTDNAQGAALLSRRLPRPSAPSAPPDDSLTPLQRTEAALPTRVGQGKRLAAATRAYFQGPDSPLLAGVAPEKLRAPAAGRHRLLPADLTVATAPSRADCARSQWRSLDYVGQLDARIAEPRLRHCATIAVVSPKGGVGKTTVTALLGTLFSLLRRDPTVAVDTNPDFGSLGRVLAPDQSWYVDDLARLVAEDDELSLTALESQLGRAIHGLLVVPAPTDPARMAALDEDAYRRVIARLKDFFSLILLDCGTGLQDPASAAAVAAADQVVLLTDAQPATASLVAQSADMLQQSGRPITVVVNRMPPKGARLDLERLSRYLPSARGMVVIPDQITAATRLAGGNFDWRDAPEDWQLAVRQLAVVLVSDWRRLGLAQ